MDEKSPQRRVKNTNATAHRSGTLRAAVKPHKRTAESNAKQTIDSFLGTVRRGTLTQTYTGETLVKNASTIRSGFGVASGDELYLLLDPTGTGRAGMLLCSTGVHLADGKGGRNAISWKDFARTNVSYANSMLTIGQTRIVSKDGQTLITLLKQLQSSAA